MPGIKREDELTGAPAVAARERRTTGRDLEALAPLHAPTLRQYVAASLREAIVSGRLPVGTRLPEPALARRLRVSRAPIREALRELEACGLVETIPRYGCFVRACTERDIEEIFEIQIRLESLAASLAARRTDEAFKAKLTSCVRELERAFERSDYVRYARLSGELRSGIRGASGSQVLIRIYPLISQRVEFFRTAALKDARVLQACFSDEKSIAQAIIAGDAARAEELTKVHLEMVKMLLIQAKICREVAGTDGTGADGLAPL